MSASIEGSFGQLLRRYRLAARYSQEGLAEAAGLGLRTIADLERGLTHYPHPHTVSALVKALGLTGDTRAAFESAGKRRGVSLFAEAPTGGAGQRETLFVGRTRERALSERLLAGEGPPLLLFSGEPGIGKSRLLTEAAAYARDAGWRVLAGGCDQRSGREPYAPFVELLAEVALATPRAQRAGDLKDCRWLARLVPEIAELAPAPVSEWARDPGQERRLMFSAVKRYLDNIAGPSGTLLLLDDLHWAGADALDLLAFLVQTTAHNWTAAPPVVRLRIAGAYRSSEISSGHPLDDLLTQLAQQELVSQRGLTRFTAEEARLLLSRLVATEPEMAQTQADEWAEKIIARAEGVPFYLVTFAQSAHPHRPDGADGDALTRADAVGWSGDQQGIPWLITAQIRQRVTALAPEAQEALAVAALIGRVAPLTLLHAALTSPEDVVVSALEAACRAHLLHEVSGGEASAGAVTFEFTHDLIRETLVESLSRARVILLHRRIGAALEQALLQAPAPERARQVAALADHLANAGEVARALPYLLEAGDRAEAAYAHAEAERYYRTALEAAQDIGDAAHEAKAFEQLGKVVHLLGHSDVAPDLLDRALRGYQALQDQQGELRALSAWLLAQAEFGRERLDEADTRAHAVLARIELPDASALPPTLLSGAASVYTNLAWIYWTSGRYPDALSHASRAVELARAAGDEKQLVVALHRLLGTPGFDGDLAAGWRDLLTLAERTEQTAMVVSAHNNIGLTHGGAGQFALGLPHMEQAVAAAEQRQDPRHLAWQLHNFARFLFDSGDWPRARDIYARGASLMREADRHGTTWQSVTMTGFPGALALAEGREDEGRRLLEETAAKIQEIGNTGFLFSTVRPLAEADLLAGDAERARLRFAPMPPSQQNAQPYLAWAEGMVGKEAQAEARLEALIAGEESLDRVDALRVQGLLATRQGRWDVAREALEVALVSARTMPWPYGELKTLWVCGQLEAARGDPAAARKQLKQALAICDRLGEGLYRTYIERDLQRLAHQAS